MTDLDRLDAPRERSDNVRVPAMDAAMLTALTKQLQPTGEHRLLPDRYCPDCGGQCIKEWLGKEPSDD